MADHDTKQAEAEKACQRAEDLFRAGNIRGAYRQARKAKRLCPSLTSVANALAAYEVVAAASGAAANNNNWRAVLGIRTGDAATQEAIKKQFRRLSLLVHPDKNGCPAAEEAFKLLRQAFDDAISAKPEEVTAGPCTRQDEQPHAAAHEEPQAAAREKKPRDATYYDVVDQRKMEKICIYCPDCKKEFPARVGPWEEKEGMECAYCPKWLQRPWPKKPEAPKEPPGAFPCSWRCPSCETHNTSKLIDGTWLLRCRSKTCDKFANVCVRGPDMVTATVRVNGVAQEHST